MAETPGTVFLNGTRAENDLDGGGYGLIIQGSFIRIDGLSLSNYSVAMSVEGDSEGNVHHQEFFRCEFRSNGGVGLQNVRNDFVLVSECRFIDDYSPDPEGAYSVQDYGVNFYWNSHIRVEDCYFFGNHHQCVSFKKNNTDGLITGCVFEGARYSAIFFGQDEIPARFCEDLIAEYNIVRPAVGHPVKTPVNCANVRNAIVRNNYFEGFDGAEATGRSGAILIWNTAAGTQQVYGNILAFTSQRPGLIIEEGVADSIMVFNNTLHSLDTDAYVNLPNHLLVANNLSSECSGSHLQDHEPCFAGDLLFAGPVIQQPYADAPRQIDHDTYFTLLTEPFELSAASPCIDTGVDLGLLPFSGTAPDMGALEYDLLSANLPVSPAFRVKNYPNPFNPRTVISYRLSGSAKVTLDIYDARGRHIRSLVDGMMPAGSRNHVWDGTDDEGLGVGTGVYFYRGEVGREIFQGKMLLVK